MVSGYILLRRNPLQEVEYFLVIGSERFYALVGWAILHVQVKGVLKGREW